ncbi:MAG: hypothetical protein V4725_04650 [Bacteroidota bacterium]
MEKFLRLLNEMEEAIPLAEKLSEKVSKSSIGWHIQHNLLVISVIIDALKRSDPSLYKWTFSLPRLLVYTFGSIPRGRSKAPKVVQPVTDWKIDQLKQEMRAIKERYKELDALAPNAFFKHPYFGHVKLKPARRFLAIHTEHHLKIIREIINKK